MNGSGEQEQQLWLLKTEPLEWSWQNQVDNSGFSVWDGVRNAQAQKNMEKMRAGDLCLFYHTGKDKEVFGIVKVVRTLYPDPTDDSGKWGAVDVQAVEVLRRPVTLEQMKEDESLKDFKMLRQPRLSVVPVQEHVWKRICELGGVQGIGGLGQVRSDTTKNGVTKKTESDRADAAHKGPAPSKSPSRKRKGAEPKKVSKQAEASTSPSIKRKGAEPEKVSKQARASTSPAKKKKGSEPEKASKIGARPARMEEGKLSKEGGRSPRKKGKTPEPEKVSKSVASPSKKKKNPAAELGRMARKGKRGGQGA